MKKEHFNLVGKWLLMIVTFIFQLSFGITIFIFFGLIFADMAKV